MINNSKTTLLAALLVPGAALAQVNVGDALGDTETAIRSALETQGYTVTEIEVEDGEIEVEASISGKAFEFEVSPETGLVLAASLDDDDDADDANDDDDGEDD